MNKVIMLLSLMFSFGAAAQSTANLTVNYEATNSVETGQQGAVSITVTNLTSQSLSVRLGKSLNYYSNNSPNAHVSIYNNDTPQASDPCQWGGSAYSPWPPWTDGNILEIDINDIPANSSVTCDGAFEIGMVEGESHEVTWFLNSRPANELLDQQSNAFRVGPLPQPTSVPATGWWSNLSMVLVILLFSMFLMKRKHP